MRWAIATTVVASILNIVLLCALSTNAGTVKNVAWSIGEFENVGNVTEGNTYIGLSNVVLCEDGDCRGVSWEDTDCTLNDGSSCDDCKTATESAIAFVVSSAVGQIPTFTTDYARLHEETDKNLEKAAAIITGIISFLSNLGAASAFSTYCYANLDGDVVDYHLGPGFLCVLFVTFLPAINAYLHWLVPVWKPQEMLADDNRNYDATYIEKSPETELSVGTEL